jgi:hypothetical protein
MSEIDIINHEKNHADAIAAYFDQISQLADPIQRRDHYARLDSDSFVDQTQQIYSLVENGDTDSRRSFDGEQVVAGLLAPPDQTDKEDLLREVWDAARSFLEDSSLSDEDALTYAGLTVAGGLLYIHPAIDGNGRVSRVWSYGLIRGSNPSMTNDLRQMLSEDGGKYWSSSPGLNSMELYAQMYMRHETATVAHEYNLTANDFQNPRFEFEKADYGVVEAATKSDVALETVSLFINRLDGKSKKALERYIERDDDGGVIAFDVDKALHGLVMQTDDGLRYGALLHEVHKAARADFVRRFLYAMKDNVAHELVDPSLLEPANEARTKIGRRRRQAVGALAVAGRILPRDYYRAKFTATSAPAAEVGFKKVA